MTGVLNALVALTGRTLGLSNQTIIDSEADPTNASAGVRLNRDGTLTFTGNAAPAEPADEWVDPDYATVGDLYEARLTVFSGEAPSSGPAAGTWWPLSSAREWLLTTDIIEDITGVWDIDIGEFGASTALVTARFTVQAIRT